MNTLMKKTIGPLFVDGLLNEGVINGREFSFAMYGFNDNYDSHVDFGPI